MENIQTFLFDDDGQIPNNSQLPLLVYEGVLSLENDPVANCRTLFRRNRWSKDWVKGVFNYHHYHSITHEVLGVVHGSADVQFGGVQGVLLKVKAGDVVVIPAGVGHCNKGASFDFRVVGAYPGGHDWDLCTGQPDERPQVIENIRKTPMPETDPVRGEQGPLLALWSD